MRECRGTTVTVITFYSAQQRAIESRLIGAGVRDVTGGARHRLHVAQRPPGRQGHVVGRARLLAVERVALEGAREVPERVIHDLWKR